MGYAKPNQDSGGIHLRQFSRTVIIEDKLGHRILYASLDAGMVSQLFRTRILEQLSLTYGSEMYNETNVMISATHTHSCPGGFFQYMLYNIPSAGFISQTLDALIEGFTRSVSRAHDSLRPARIYYKEGELLDASINRSPSSYENNPIEERALYKYNTDKGFYLLKIVDRNNEPIAMINWFAVHGTSMNNTNHLISSDNKGFASLLLEKDLNPVGTLPGKGKFVAIFAQANEGDVSPNTEGPRCIDTGLPCDLLSSTCGNPPRNEKCIASGPGKDMFESTKIIAYKQYQKAKQLWLSDNQSEQQLRGPVKFVHEHIDMTQQLVPLYKSVVDLASRQESSNLEIISKALNSTYETCKPGLGYSFAAGTTDGPGAFDFQQGDTVSTRYWNMIRDFMRRPSEQQISCHHPKPILLSTGEMEFPYMWHPRIVPTQIFMIGQLAIVALPGEFTTMAGRRVRASVLATLQSRGTNLLPELDETFSSNSLSMLNDTELDMDIISGTEDGRYNSKVASVGAQALRRSRRQYSTDNRIRVVLSGLSNIYTSYITTLEEYQVQRYEGASTLYGPHTLQAYINQFKKLASKLINNKPARSLADSQQETENSVQLQPPDLTKSLFTLKAGVIFDGAPHGKSFGSLVKDVEMGKVYKCQDTVKVSFVAGNPRNDLRLEDSFLYIDRYFGNGTWTPIATDSSWETKFIWERTNTFFGESNAIIVWEIPHNCSPGVYRIRHYGAHKSLLQTITQYSGQSSLFMVSNNNDINTLINLNETLKLAIEFNTQVNNAGKRLQGDQHQQYKQSASSFSSTDVTQQSVRAQPSFYSPINLLNWLGWRSKRN